MLAEIAEEAGAEIHLDRAVERFLIEDGRAIGIQLADGTEIRSRAVVSNLDPKRTLLKMVGREHLDGRFRRRIQGLVTQVSCYKFLAVISELPRWKGWDGDPELPSVGDVRLGVSRAEALAAYDDLDAGRPPKAPLISFMVPSVLDPSLTQPGYHTASIWIYPVPGKLREGTWDNLREEVAEGLIDQITEFAPNFRESVRHYRLRTPFDLEREVGLTDGCIWHIQHGGDQLFWNRPLPELAAYRAPFKRVLPLRSRPASRRGGQRGSRPTMRPTRSSRIWTVYSPCARPFSFARDRWRATELVAARRNRHTQRFSFYLRDSNSVGTVA